MKRLEGKLSGFGLGRETENGRVRVFCVKNVKKCVPMSVSFIG